MPSAIASANDRKKFTCNSITKREHHVGAEAVELAVGEIHHPHDAEDQRQADAEQRVNAAEHEGVHTMLEEFVHAARHSELPLD